MFMQDLEFYRDEMIEIIYIRRMEHYWPAHNHPSEYQILLVFDGTLSVQYRDEAITLQQDQFLVIPPYRTHIERSEGPISVLCLSISKWALDQDGATLLNLIDDIVEKLQKRGLLETKHIVNLSRAASQILYVYRNTKDECAEFVAEAREMLEKWPEKQISLDEMSELVSICRSHLLRTFKREMDMTPHQFQIQNRVKKATRLLIDTDKKIETICRECGFYDKSHFKRNFRRLLGMTPYEYRNAFKQAGRLFG